jgi:hypothetical protein
VRSFRTRTLHQIFFKEDEVGGASARMGKMRNACKMLVGTPERKKPLRRLKHMWEDNIRMNLGEIGLQGVDWIHLTQDRTIVNLQVA